MSMRGPTEREIEYALTVNIEDAADKTRKLERIIFSLLRGLDRLGIPNLREGIGVLQSFMSTARQTRIELNLLAEAFAVGGWWTWGLALASGITLAFTLIDRINEVNSE